MKSPKKNYKQLEIERLVDEIIDLNRTNTEDIHFIEDLLDSDEPLINALLFIKEVSKKRDGPSHRINRLVSFLKSHVDLLESLVHNPELCTLFIIGEHGSQSFDSIHKSVLLEQSSRSRMLISEYPEAFSKKGMKLSKFISYLESPTHLEDKIKELDQIESTSRSMNKNELVFLVSELFSILNGCLVFNDILVKSKKNHIEIHRNENNDSKKEHYVSIIREINEEKSTLHQQVIHLESQVSNLKEKQSQMDDLEIQIRNLNSKSEFSNSELKAKIRDLEDENSHITKRLNNSITDNRVTQGKLKDKKEKIYNLKLKINEANKQIVQTREELKSLQTLYTNSSVSLNQALERCSSMNNRVMNCEEDQKRLQKHNTELQNLLSNAQETLKTQIHDNHILLKQLKKYQESPEQTNIYREDNERLKKELEKANSFIHKLQMKIEKFRSKKDSQHNEILELSQLDIEITKLENNVKESKKVVQV